MSDLISQTRSVILTPFLVLKPFSETNFRFQVLVMVDFQEGLINMVKDWDTALYKSNILAHSGIAQLFDLPVIITAGAPQGPNGVIPKEILAMHPNTTVVHSEGHVNYWDNKEFRDALKATGKSQVIIAGITTDVCKCFRATETRGSRRIERTSKVRHFWRSPSARKAMASSPMSRPRERYPPSDAMSPIKGWRTPACRS